MTYDPPSRRSGPLPEQHPVNKSGRSERDTHALPSAYAAFRQDHLAKTLSNFARRFGNLM